MTIKEIAQRMNVSPTTVSNVIHGNLKKVSQEKAQQISEQLKAFNYVPNMGARILAAQDSHIIGVIMKSLDDPNNSREKYSLQASPFNSAILCSLEQQIRENRYYMIFYVAKEISEILDVICGWNIDGLIVWGVEEEQCVELQKSTSKPIVFIDGYPKDTDRISNIGLEDEYGGYLCTEHLIENGHKKIAFLTDTYPFEAGSRYRYNGYRKALAEAGIPYDEKMLIVISSDKNVRTADYDRIISHIDRYSALFFDSDYYAVEGMNYLLDHGIKIPDDISVVGFDDNTLSRIVRPSLTTIRQNVADKAIVAVQQLMNMIKNPDSEPQNIILPVELITRNSVKRIEKNGEEVL